MLIMLLAVDVGGVIFASVGVLAFVIGAVWLFNDAMERFDTAPGCLVVMLYIMFAPVFPLLLLGYYLFIYRPMESSRPPSKKTLGEPYFAPRSYVKPEAGGEGAPSSPADIRIAEEERVEELDELIAQGELETALSRAEELLETAKSFDDDRGVVKFTRYMQLIRARMKV